MLPVAEEASLLGSNVSRTTLTFIELLLSCHHFELPMMKFLLIDAMGLVFRAYHAMSKMGLQAPNGEPTSAVFGFGNILATILTKEQPDYLCIAFDTSAPTFRHERFEAYKAHRPEFPADLVPQLARIKQLITYLNIRQVELPGYEADDIIGTLATRFAEQHDLDVFCVTSDKDYCQLVSERIKLLRPGFSMGEYETVDVAAVRTKFGVPPERVVDVLALIGDASDNVPGVKGIGDKTGIPLIQEYGSLERLYDNLAELKKDAVRKKLETHREMAFLSKELVTIHLNVPVDMPLEEFVRHPPNVEGLHAFFQQLGFRTMLSKFVQAAGVQHSALPTSAAGSESVNNTVQQQPSRQEPAFNVAASAQTQIPVVFRSVTDVPHEYILVDSLDKLHMMVEELRRVPLLAFDCETTSLSTMTCELVGVSLAGKEHRAFYVPVFAEPFIDSASSPDDSLVFQASQHQESLFADSRNEQTTAYTKAGIVRDSLPAPVHRALQALLEDTSLPKCGQNAKFDAVILRRYGIRVTPIVFDTMLASYVLNPGALHNMDVLARTWLHYRPIPISSLIGSDKKTQRSMRDVPVQDVAEYAAEDADITLQLAEVLKGALERERLLDFAQKVEMPLVEVLADMEYNGIAIDVQALASISALIRTQAAELVRRIYAETAPFGVSNFNVDSPKQLGEILFDVMKIPPTKKTKTGYSTDSSVLEELSAQHPIAALVLEYRQYQKLQSTYVEALPKLVHPQTGRIHTTFNQTVTNTGRLSSSDPNLQNIPIRTELGREIRRAFVAQKPEQMLLSADYSQIELRIMAHICGDETLVQAFQEGLDIHAAMASKLFSVSVSAVSREQRRIAKTVNFGVMYGQGAFGLAGQLRISRSEGKAIIDNYFSTYPRIKEYIDKTIAETRENGYAQTLLGRRAFYPDITSSNHNLRAAAERAAINMPIQGTAADMMKLAMIAIAAAMKQQGLRSTMLLQIHDELIFEMMPEERDVLPVLVKSCMESVFSLGAVPVVAEIGVGRNWAEAH